MNEQNWGFKLTQPGSHDNGNSTTKLHREPTRGRHKSQAVTQVLHDIITISPQTDDYGCATERPGLVSATEHE
jgi:hypothetical protein